MATDTCPATLSDREMRRFGTLLGVLLGLSGGYWLWHGHGAGGLGVVVGVVTAVAFRLRWPGTCLVFGVWMAIAKVLGRVTTTVLLSVLYLGVLTPLALVARLCGQRFVDRGFRSQKKSYWVPRQCPDASCDKQY